MKKNKGYGYILILRYQLYFIRMQHFIHGLVTFSPFLCSDK